MVEVTMTAGAADHLDAHVGEANRFPLIDASLHQPCSSCVPRCMRRHAPWELGEMAGGIERGDLYYFFSMNWLFACLAPDSMGCIAIYVAKSPAKAGCHISVI